MLLSLWFRSQFTYLLSSQQLSCRLQLHCNEETGKGAMGVSPEYRMGSVEARKSAEDREQWRHMQRKQGNNLHSGFSGLQKEKHKSKLVTWTLLKASDIAKCSSTKSSWRTAGAHMTGWFHQRFPPKNEKKAQELVWEHVYTMYTCAWAASQAGSACTLFFQKNTSAENETVSEAGEGKHPCLGTAHLQEQGKHCERHCSRAMLLHVTVPLWGERQIWIFFCRQALTKINLSIWPIMKEASKTKVTSVSRQEPSVFFITGEKTQAACLEFAPGVHRAEVLPITLQF